MKKPLFSAGASASAVAVILAAAPAQAATQDLAPLITAAEGGVAGSYVVSLHEGADPSVVAAELGVPVEHRFTEVLNGFTTDLDPASLHRVRLGDEIRSITQVRHYQIESRQTPAAPAPWGLDRIDQPKLPLNGKYAPRHDGAGITAYIIDSGIAPKNPEFEGRARIGFDAYGGNGFDGNSHGTFAAGIVGGKTFGVAKKVSLVGVKVLADNGTGTTGSLLAGMEWVARNAKGPAIANMSIGGPKDPTINEAAHNMVAKAGVFLAASAGNWAGDANTVSPASADGVFTVASSNKEDRAAKSTNHGATIEGFAPGVKIASVLPNGKVGTRSGTATATAHVSGAAALFLQAHPKASPADIVGGLRAGAAKNVIRDAPEETTTDLLQVAGP